MSLRSASGFTLAEVVVSMGLLSLMALGIIHGYIQSARRVEWSAYSLAAQAMAVQRIEQARSAKWDRLAFPPVDQLVDANFPVAAVVLDVPVSGSNFVYATNYTTISDVSSDPPLRMIQVDCVWPFTDGERFTNTVVTYRAPDQ